jgi:chorismate dehydratase
VSYVVGCVPYVNAVPLVARFEEQGPASPVRVVYDVPSRLPALLDSGAADAVLVSSVDALTVPGRRMADGVCIGSDGPVKSVRLFSKVPPEEIRSLALDASSLTSNRLAQILLRERYGVRPSVRHHPPDLAAMLRESDAAVLIGDLGMTAAGDGLQVLDLGAEWKALTGRPFVWAGWIGRERLTPELARMLEDAPRRYREDAEREALRASVVAAAAAKSGWSEGTVRDYFENVMAYQLDEPMRGGLEEFSRRLQTAGFDDCRWFPEFV